MGKKITIKPLFLVLGVVFFVATQFISLPDIYQKNALSILCLMAFYWVTEAMPLWMTSLLPFVLFCIFPVTSGVKEKILGYELKSQDSVGASFLVAVSNFFDQNLGLFLGGMIIGAAMQVTGLHRRIALTILRFIGVSKSGLILGFLCATAFISLWISNTATSVMMLPIAISVLREIAKREEKVLPAFSAGLVLTIAYGANLGGIGTKIGTAPNVLFCTFAEKHLKVEVDFLHYLVVGLPIVLFVLPIIWFTLRMYSRKDELTKLTKDIIDIEVEKLGRMSGEEKAVVIYFLCAVLLWIFGKPIGEAIKMKKQFDSIVAMVVGLLIFIIPIKGKPVVNRSAVKLISWDALILLGGSFALAGGCSTK